MPRKKKRHIRRMTVPKEGPLSQWCREHGFPGATDEAVLAASQKGDPHIQRLARFAALMRGLALPEK